MQQIGANIPMTLDSQVNDFNTAVEAALKIVEQEESLMEAIRVALAQGNEAEALRLTRILCGVEM